jgi:hypothetical protein
MDACKENGTFCTVGDFSVGTPSMQAIPILKPMLQEAARLGMWFNYHCYSSQTAQGNTDMAFEAEWFAMRWQQIAEGVPDLKIVGGETGNSGGNGLYRQETPNLMQQFADMVKTDPRFVSGNWWEVVSGTAHQDWAKDDWTSILPWYFNWAAAQ